MLKHVRRPTLYATTSELHINSDVLLAGQRQVQIEETCSLFELQCPEIKPLTFKLHGQCATPYTMAVALNALIQD